MGKFSTKLFFVSVFILSFGFLALRMPFSRYHAPQDSDHYFKAAFEKHRILETMPSPRFIFVGGSNLAFGLDSKLIEKKLNRHVVNMGLHGGLGLRYMLAEVAPEIRQGDVIVIIPEYEEFYDDLLNGSAALIEYLTFFSPGIRYINHWKQCLTIFKYSPEYIRNSVRRLIKFSPDGNQEDRARSIYRRSGFNENGDLTAHLNLKSTGLQSDVFLFSKSIYNSEAAAVLNDFYRMAVKRGAKCFFIFPPMPAERYEKEKKELGELEERLKSHLKMPILSGSRRYLFPGSCFFNTDYHLNSAGRESRTLRVIQNLQGQALS